MIGFKRINEFYSRFNLNQILTLQFIPISVRHQNVCESNLFRASDPYIIRSYF